MKPAPERLPSRRALILAGALGALVALCSCYGSVTSASASPSPRTTATAGPAVPENLTFTGALAGRMTSGSPGDTFVCASTGGSFVAGPILGTVSGLQVEMNITKLPFKGAGSYAPGGVTFDAGSDHYYPATGAAGSLVVAADLQSGSVDIELAVNTDPSHVVGHVAGAWRCPPGGS